MAQPKCVLQTVKTVNYRHRRTNTPTPLHPLTHTHTPTQLAKLMSISLYLPEDKVESNKYVCGAVFYLLYQAFRVSPTVLCVYLGRIKFKTSLF